jgi:membrane fusion protein (multidrug efflux system)
VPGLVQKILFESGGQVASGQPLVKLDADVERANLASAVAALKLAKANLARGESLRSTDSISKATLEQRQSEYEVASAQTTALSAQIEKKAINAPFDGVLGIRKINVGEYLEAGDPIVNLQDLTVMLVNFSVSQKELAALVVGEEVHMTTDAYPGREFGGEISAIEPLIDEETGMVAIQGRFDNAGGLLRPGMFAKLSIVLPARMSVVTVPQTSISYSLYGDFVYVATEGKGEQGDPIITVQRRVVRTGERRNGQVIIEEGLAAGELTVTSGQLKLDNGTRVSLAEKQSLTPPAVIPAE